MVRATRHLVRHTGLELLAAAAESRQNPDDISVEAVTLRRGLAHQLVDQGFGASEVATLLGLSYVRALQLISERAPVRHLDMSVSPVASERTGHQVRPHTTYRHEAFLYESEEEFLTGTVPFILDGVAAGQPVMVALVPERLQLLRTAVGAESARVSWVDMTELGGNPGRIVPAWRRFVDEHGTPGTPVRGIGEPIWLGRRPAEVEECQLHEALLNLAIEPDTPLWLRCPYDAHSLPPAVVEESLRSHPALVAGGDYRGSTLYGGASHAAAMFAGELPEPTEVEEREFDRRGVADVRHLVQSRAAALGVSPARRADLALAVTEAANNSIRHGGGRGALRVWHDSGSLTCEVRDDGHIADLLVGRRMPEPTQPSSRGLWLVHQLSDLAQIRSSTRGSTVRMTCWL